MVNKNKPAPVKQKIYGLGKNETLLKNNKKHMHCHTISNNYIRTWGIIAKIDREGEWEGDRERKRKTIGKEDRMDTSFNTF